MREREGRERQRERWDEFYRSGPSIEPDPWLERRAGLFALGDGARVLDLGCGDGSNLPFLLGTGAGVFACDYAEEAIRGLRARFPAAVAAVADMREPLPYPDGAFDLVLADLSLHYFDAATTRRLAAEIRRILKPGALLLARLNSLSDYNHGAGAGEEVERGLFSHEGRLKRFFDRRMILELFGASFELVEAGEGRSGKYREEKALWEAVLRARAASAHIASPR